MKEEIYLLMNLEKIMGYTFPFCLSFQHLEPREIESLLEVSVGGHLERLEHEFGLIKKRRPILSMPKSQTIKYQIHDNFLNFWFRFIYKYRSAVEIGNFSYIKQIISRDYTTYSGRFLEKYFRERILEDGDFLDIGSFWKKMVRMELIWWVSMSWTEQHWWWK